MYMDKNIGMPDHYTSRDFTDIAFKYIDFKMVDPAFKVITAFVLEGSFGVFLWEFVAN